MLKVYPGIIQLIKCAPVRDSINSDLVSLFINLINDLSERYTGTERYLKVLGDHP